MKWDISSNKGISSVNSRELLEEESNFLALLHTVFYDVNFSYVHKLFDNIFFQTVILACYCALLQVLIKFSIIKQIYIQKYV